LLDRQRGRSQALSPVPEPAMATMAGSAFPSCQNLTPRRRCLYLWSLKSSPVFKSSYNSKPAAICAFHHRSRRNKTTTSTPDRTTSYIREEAYQDEREVGCICVWILKSSPVFKSSYNSKPAVICAFHNRSRRNKTTTSTPDRTTSYIPEGAFHDEKEVDCDCCWCCGCHAGSGAG